MENLEQAIDSLILLEQRYIIDMISYSFDNLDKYEFAKHVYPELRLFDDDDMDELECEMIILKQSFTAYWYRLDEERKLKFIKFIYPHSQYLSLAKPIIRMVLQHDRIHRLEHKVDYPDEIFEKFN